MDEQSRFQQLVCLVAAAAISFSSAFNIDVTNPDIYSGERKDFFGYKVLQLSRTKGIIVTAPLRLNGLGGVFSRDQSHNEKWFSPDEASQNSSALPKHLGLSIAANPTGSHFTVCSPTLAHECHKNSYLNSLCYNITDKLQEVSSFKPLFQNCTQQTVNLVFLFDGSGSMTTDEFNKNKVFIKEIMNSLKNSSFKFAAVQFSIDTRTVFHFNDYDAGDALKKLEEEQHMKSLTNTHKALEFVLKNIFENSSAGASPDATKAVVIITDGDPSDIDSYNIVQRYDQKGIIRVVIGVKDVKIEKFKTIASEPKDKNVYKIENYNGLGGILTNLQNRIFTIEGSKVSRAGTLTNELSQSGFSSVFYKDTLILGSVGSNDWRGSLLEQQSEKQISDPKIQQDSYMGYSLSVGEKNGRPLYFAGAPRFNHTGQVLLFTREDKNWSTAQRLDGDQIGSYFGAELCSVDIDSDSNTDFLLVGAPQFYQPYEHKEGRIYIYSLSEKTELQSVFTVEAPSIGRFGSTIASLSDLNGDRLQDVAVGAPLEDDNTGAVYIYLGDRNRGIRSSFTQRITGRELGPGIRFFGLAIDGGIDLGDDQLPDVVFGSQGAAVVLRSKPVFNVQAHLSFHPAEISIEKIVCGNPPYKNVPMVNITACFILEEATKSKADAASSGLNISYTINLDPTRQTSRGFFLENEKINRSFTHIHELLKGETCFNYSTYMKECVKDTLSNIIIKLNMSQADSENASVSLNIDSRKEAVIEIPFEKRCENRDMCIAQLDVDFSFMSEMLFVSQDGYLNVSITLTNHGDDSFNTSLTMFYPPGLSFSMMDLKQSSRFTLYRCDDLDGVINETVCNINRPVFHSKSSATFAASFRVSKDFKWNDIMTMTVAGKSDNSNSSRIDSMTKSVPVQYEIRMTVTKDDNTVTYLNFTTDDAAPKDIVVIYRIDNIGFKSFPVNVSLVFPNKLEYNFEVIGYQVLVPSNETQCWNSSDVDPEQNCSTQDKCIIMKCNTFILEKYSTVEFHLVGKVQFKDLKHQAANIAFLKRYTGDSRAVKFRSAIKVEHDEKKYFLVSHKHQKKSSKPEEPNKTVLRKNRDPTIEQTEVQVEFFIPQDQLLIILTGAGLGFLLLIIITFIMFKLGCFRRKTLQYYQEQDDNISAENGNPETSNASDTVEKSEQLPEKKTLLEEAESS